ncbi:MAG: ABC transporter substrate-binding protein [Aeromicrobium sp.]|uniref:ABC transporter substrate-binding protein n=1 Tax=Aeromicrobium sp. TaxID=1871063 RepID=UPI0025C57218|nr:ABC transporter substrate-binding protein [Aeromicrobium sp.]MCK5892692.1 ABC transporter substrate-binding protein [Aeromicrobium sp.]MDF1703647.1 ABC transporter substrate-binding protein [Aeromicrobium sp.]
MSTTLRRLSVGLGSALAVCVLSACGSDTADAPNIDSSRIDPELQAMLPDDVRESGILEVASDVPYPPFEFYDTDGKTVVGLDPDLGKAIGDLLGLELRFNAVTYDTMIPSLASGKYDLAFTGMSDTPDRQKQLTFVDYLTTGGSFLITGDSEEQPAALEDLCGLSVGAQSGTYIVEFLQTQVAPGCPAAAQLDLSQFTGQDDLVNALRSGRVDVAVIPSPSAGYLVETTGDEFDVSMSLDVGLVGIAFPREDAQLAAAFQAALQHLMDDGTYAEILDSYGLGDNVLTEATIDAGSV